MCVAILDGGGGNPRRRGWWQSPSAVMPMEAVAAALARLSKAQAKCAKELHALSESHASSPAWVSAGIAAVVRLCHDPAPAADAAATLTILPIDDANDDRIREAGAIPPLVALLSGGLEAEAARNATGALRSLAMNDANRHQRGGRHPYAIPPLVARLSSGPKSKVAADASGALANLASNDEANQVAIGHRRGGRHPTAGGAAVRWARIGGGGICGYGAEGSGEQQ